MYIHVPGALKVHLVNELNNLYHDAKITHVRPTTQINVFFTSTLIITNFLLSSAISFDSANLGFSAKK